MAVHYGITDLAEARSYLRHPVLGARLRECAQLVLGSPATSAEEMFGPVDAVKLRSSMTLFDAAAPDVPAFGQVIDRYFRGRRDELTLSKLR